MKATDVGKIGEKIAAKYLRKQRYKVIETNKHQSHNEIDLIVSNKNYIVFVEVKTRTVNPEDMYLPYGSPASAVTQGKRNRTVAAANNYLNTNRFSKHAKKQPRIDVVEVYLEKDTAKLLKLNHIADAFGSN